MPGLGRFNQKRHDLLNQNLEMLYPIINTCILKCPSDSDNILCKSKCITYTV